MQSVINGVERSGAVVFVRSLAHVPNAIRAVNQLLSLRRSCTGSGHRPGCVVCCCPCCQLLDSRLTTRRGGHLGA